MNSNSFLKTAFKIRASSTIFYLEVKGLSDLPLVHSQVIKLVCRLCPLTPSPTLFIFKDFISLFFKRGEGRERGRNIDVQGKHQPVASRAPQPGIWPAAQARALDSNQIGDLSVCRTTSSPLHHTSRGKSNTLPITLYCLQFLFLPGTP